jgi:hypothetical protein
MGYAPSPGYGPVRTYEFNELENTTIAGTARYARLWGIISLVSGILLLLMGITLIAMASLFDLSSAGTASSSGGVLTAAAIIGVGIAILPSALVNIIGGIFYIGTGNALRAVVDTQGNDIELLMSATRSLSRALMIEGIATIVGFLIGLAITVVNYAAQSGGGH